MDESTNKLPQLLMRRDLTDLPPLNLPDGVTVRHFQEGDEGIWENIISLSFESPHEFNPGMKDDSAFRNDRVLFLLVEGVPVATASAWFVPKYGDDTGFVHMVGALPSYQGRRLGYWVTLAVLYKLKAEGYLYAVLTTDDFRLAAIKTYLNLGFSIDKSDHGSIPERWEKIKAFLDKAPVYKF